MNAIFTPRGFLTRAVLCWLVFAILHLAGLREYTGLLTMTKPAGVPYLLAATGATTYIVFYLAAILLAPILAIAALLLWLWERIAARQ